MAQDDVMTDRGPDPLSFEKAPPATDPRGPGAQQGPPPGWQAPPAYGPPGWYPGYPPPRHPFAGYPPPGPKPPDNIGWAIAAIFLFWPLCLPGFIFAGQVDTAWFAGDYPRAMKASHDARFYGRLGVCIGAGLIVLWVLFLLVAVGLAA